MKTLLCIGQLHLKSKETQGTDLLKMLISFIESNGSLKTQRKYFFYECFVEKIKSELVTGRERGDRKDNNLIEKD